MSSANSLVSVNSAMKNISKGNQLREEMELMVGPHCNWEDFLVPAPMCVCLLGDLILISTVADFTLEKKPPKDGFKLLSWPHSFRACLMQVTNSGWEAFNVAHKNMDRVRLLSANVPNHLREAVEILFNGADHELEDMLPIPLGAIQESADKCLAFATEVEEKFVFVMSLTAELLEACVSAKGGYEHQLRETEIALQIAKENGKTYEERKKMTKKTYDELEKSVKKAEKSYDDAMKSLPSGYDIIGMDVVEGLGNAFTSVCSGITSLATRVIGAKIRKVHTTRTADSIPAKTTDIVQVTQRAGDPAVTEGTIEAYDLASKLQTHTNILVAQCMENGVLKTSLQHKMDLIIYSKKQISNILKGARSASPTPVQDRVKAVAEKGITICSELEQCVNSMQVDSQLQSRLAKDLLSLQGDVMALATEGKIMMGANPTDTRAPCQNLMSPKASQDASASQQAVQNARFKIEQSAAQLEHVQKQYDKACDKLVDSSQKLGEIMAEMSKLDMTKIDFEKIKQTLIRGIKALGELREQWDKLVGFFQMMSNIIKCCLNTSLKGFLQYAKTSQEHSLKGYPISSLKKDMIYQQAFQAAKISHVVNMISESYVEVSNKHITHRIAGLGSLMAFDSEKEMDKIQGERMKLISGCKEAQADIRRLVLKRKGEFDRQVQSRIRKIRDELQKALPPPEPSDKSAERIQKAVEQGMQNVAAQTVETKGLDPDDFC